MRVVARRGFRRRRLRLQGFRARYLCWPKAGLIIRIEFSTEVGSVATPRTLADKLWDRHVVRSAAGEPDLLYIDLHLVHEVTSPQAFEGLRLAGRGVRRPDLTLATADHNVPTVDRDKTWPDPLSIRQVDVLRQNVKEF